MEIYPTLRSAPFVKTTLVILFIIILLLQIIYITITNELVPFGKKYQDLQDEIQGIKKENIMLREDVLTHESYENILYEAKKRGFIYGAAISL